MLPAKPGPRRPNWPDKIPGVATSTKRAMVVGFSAIAITFGGFGIWSTTVPISGGVVANGQVIVASKRKMVQHPTGGVVRALHVEDGSVVKQGEVLVELEDADALERYARTRDSFFLALATESRLMAEALDQQEMQAPAELTKAAATNPTVKAMMDGQHKLFDVRRVEMRGQLSIIEEQHEQLKDELNGLNAERTSATRQIGLTKEELATVEDLFEKGYTTRTRVFSLRREMTQLSGSAGRIAANTARTRSALMENELKLAQARNQIMTAVNGELRETQAKVPTLREQYHAAKKAYDSMTIRAPVAGTVMASRLNTLGSVVRAGDTILEIVPADDRLMVEVQLRPNDVDSVKVGLQTEIKLTGINQRTAVPIYGKVTHVSADAMQDSRTNATYFIAHVDVPESEIERLKGVHVQPGMPAAVMIKTGDRTALAYLTQPLTDSINRAWREN